MGRELPIWEERALAAIEAAAELGARFPTCDDLVDAIGCECVATTANVVARLEQKGLIIMERYQRERVGTIVSTGKRTAEARNKAPPWRHRAEHGLEPVALLRQKHNQVFKQMLVQARKERRSMAGFLADFIADAWTERLIQGQAREG